MITRTLEQILESKLFKGKAIIVIGARQVGKSTLLHNIADRNSAETLFLECDDLATRQLLATANIEQLKGIIGNNKLVVIDEAQLVSNIGRTLKIIIDHLKDVQLMVSGSSAFELHNKLNEPLTGRKYEYRLYPISTEEIFQTGGLIQTTQTLKSRLIYGSYPDVINHAGEAREVITNISESYLYKDLLSVESIRKPVLINKILVALALQIGNEVSFNEIAQIVGSDSKTVEKYIDLLEKCYIIFRLNALSRNLRNELKKRKKVYFYDNGIRNSLIQNFAPIEMRSDKDIGGLWENFFISERIKRNHYHLHFANYYFWRTTEQKEIDFIEECDGQLTAIETKWDEKKAKRKFPKEFLDTYPVADAVTVTPSNYLDWLM